MLDQTERLAALASRATGLRYDSDEAATILDAEEWENHWPVVDAEGLLTGDVVETAECEGYANVDDMAMIAIADLTAEQLDASGGEKGIRESGYAQGV